MLVAFLALIVFTAWRISAGRTRGGPDAALVAFVWCSFLIMAYAVALSLFERLGPLGMMLLAACGAAVAGLLARRARTATFADVAPGPTRREWAWIALGLLPPIAFIAGSLFIVSRAPETGYDNLAYHLPRLGYWIQQREVSAFLANNPRIGSFPPNGNVLHLVPALFLRHDRLCGAVQLVSMAAAGLGIYATARALHAGRAAALFAALGWFTVPSAAAQASLTMVDVTASAFVVAAVYFLVRRPAEPFHLFTSLLATGLAVGTKHHLLVIGVPLAVLATVALFRRHPAALPRVALGIAAAALPLGGAFALQNWTVWGNPGGLPSVRWVVVGPGLASFVKNLELLLVPLVPWWPGGQGWAYGWKETLTGEGFGLYWIALAGVSLALLAWDLAHDRGRDLGPWLVPVGSSLGAGLVLVATLRHQHAVYRFLLPLGALLTVLFAWTFERLATRARGRWILLALAWTTAVWVLGCHGYWNLAKRRPGGAWLGESQRYGTDLEPFAVEIDRRSRDRPLRVGVMSGQYFFEGLFLGRGYRNTPVPLSYHPPATLREIDALGLDVLWVGTAYRCQEDLFRRALRAPAAARTISWTPATRDFDADFMNAYAAAIELADARPTLQALGEPGSTWGLVAHNQRGALFARGDGRRFGVEELCDVPQ